MLMPRFFGPTLQADIKGKISIPQTNLQLRCKKCDTILPLMNGKFIFGKVNVIVIIVWLPYYILVHDFLMGLHSLRLFPSITFGV